MSVSVYMYSALLKIDPTKQLDIEIVATFASCVIASGILNLILVWSQMMCLCVCHEKYVRKSIRLAQCVCKCKDKADLNFLTMRKTKKPQQKQKSTLKSTSDKDKNDTMLLSQSDLQESPKKEIDDSKETIGDDDTELNVQNECPQPLFENDNKTVRINNAEE